MRLTERPRPASPYDVYTLRNANGYGSKHSSTYGGIIISLTAPDAGHYADVVLGYRFAGGLPEMQLPTSARS